MSEDVIIKIGSKIEPTTKTGIEAIGESARQADAMVATLNKNLAILGKSDYTKGVIDAQTKLTSANTKAIKANIMLAKEEREREKHTNALAISVAQLGRVQKQTELITAKITAEGLKEAEVKIRQTLATAKLTDSKAKELTATAKLIDSYSKLASNINLVMTAEQKQLSVEMRLSLEKERLAQAILRTSAMQRKQDQELRMLADGTDRASAALRRLEAQQERGARSSSFYEMVRKNTIQTASFTRALRTLALYFGVREILGLSDAYTNLGNRLKLVTTSADQLTYIQKDLFRIANASRQAIDVVAQSFQRFDLALVQLGASQKESLRFTETLAKMITISGVTTNEASSVMLQFSQAMNKGKLDGEEFKAVMEAMPMLMDSIARTMNKTRGELLELAPQGEITSQVMRKAMILVEKEVDERMSGMGYTFGQAFTLMRNKTIEFFENFKTQSSFFANLIVSIANNLGFLLKSFTTLTVGLGAYYVSTLLAAKGTGVLQAALTRLGLLLAPFVALPTLIAGAITALILFRDDIKVTFDGGISLGDVFRGVWLSVTETFDGAIAMLQKFRETPIFGFIKDSAKSAFDYLTQAIKGMYALYTALKASVFSLFENFPQLFANIFIKAFNFSLEQVKSFILKMADLAKTVPFVGDRFNISKASLDKALGSGIKELDIDGGTPAEVFAKTFEKTVMEDLSLTEIFKKETASLKSLFMPDFFGSLDFLDGVWKNIKKVSAERKKDEKITEEVLRKEKELKKLLEDREKLLKLHNEEKQRKAAVFDFEYELFTSPAGKSPEQAKADKVKADLDKVEQWEKEQLEMLNGLKTDNIVFLEGINQKELTLFQSKADAMVAIENEKARKIKAIQDGSYNEDKERDLKKLELQAELFGNIGALFANFESDNKKRNKAAFLAQQSFAFASATLNMWVAISNALDDTISGPIKAASMAVQHGAILGNIIGTTIAGFKDGGLVTGPGGDRDDEILARLSNNEFVVNATATKKHRSLLEAINGNRYSSNMNETRASTFGNSSAPTTSGMGKPVVVNVYNDSGINAEIQTTEMDEEIKIDIYAKKIDNRLAKNFKENTGALTQVINSRIKRGF